MGQKCNFRKWSMGAENPSIHRPLFSLLPFYTSCSFPLTLNRRRYLHITFTLWFPAIPGEFHCCSAERRKPTAITTLVLSLLSKKTSYTPASIWRRTRRVSPPLLLHPLVSLSLSCDQDHRRPPFYHFLSSGAAKEGVHHRRCSCFPAVHAKETFLPAIASL